MERNYESNKFGQLIEPQSITGTTYNGIAATTVTGYGLDTQGYEGITIQLNSGTFTGAGALDVAIYESDDDVSSPAPTAISGAEFTQVTTANDQAVQKAYIKTSERKRYLHAKAVASGDGTCTAQVNYALHGKAVNPEVAQADLEFCVDGSV